MGDESEVLTAAKRPTITVPARASFEALFTGGYIPGFSPGPMSLVSSFFSDPENCSFSQLLAEAMISPIAKPSSFLGGTCSSRSGDAANERVSGYKQNRPAGLVLAQSPLFTVPPGLSPSGFLNSPGFLSPLQSPFGMSHQQALAHVTAQAALSQSYMQLHAELQLSSQVAPAESLEDRSCPVSNENLQQQINTVPSKPQTIKAETPEISQSNKKPAEFSVDKVENDGYNWRKYGQKQVKASEFPRSYYRCTHLNCPVKKKVERSSDGHITEITYKSQHNHDPPQPNKRAKDGSETVGISTSQAKPLHSSLGQTDIKACISTSSAPAVGHLSSHTSSEHLPVSSQGGGSEDSQSVVNEDDENDQTNAKRRCMEAGASNPAPSHRTVTESRIIVQTRSEVDLLDDGFKWRKYGQKVVKGNSYPRSYYRCTHAGCNVRKHVERASMDPKAVITTYEGKHNHEAPTAKNSYNNSAKSRGVQLKSQNMFTETPALHTGMDFESKNQIPVSLQLKHNEIAA